MPAALGTIAGRVVLDTRQAVASYAALRAQNARTVYALRGTGDSFVGAGKVMGAAGLGMVYTFGKVVNAAAEFERKMDFFGAVSDTNSAQMQKLSKFTLQLAQDTIYSAGQIADGFIELGKSGVSATQIMNGVGKAVANLGAAGDIPLVESGQIITSTIQQFDLSARQAVKVTDLLAGAANASIADITDIGVSLKYVGGVASAAGLTFEDTATAISLLAKAGIRGSTAGTSLRQMIVSLGGATMPANNALRELGIITGENNNAFYTATGKLKPLNKVYQILQDHLDGFNQKEKLAYLRTIFNNRALSAAAILTREGSKGFRDMNKEMGKTSAADVAHKRLDNLSGDLEILRGNIETFMVQAGTPFQDVLRGWVKQITQAVQAFGELDPATQKMIIQTIGITGATLVAMGALSIFIGMIFRIAAAALKLYAALGLVGRLIRLVAVNARFAAVLFGGELAGALGVTAGVFAIIVVAVLAFLAVWTLAYKKIDIFRKAVNAWYGAIWSAIKAFGAFIKLLATNPGAAWDKIKAAASSALSTIVEWLKTLPGIAKRALSDFGDMVGNVVSSSLSYLEELPGKGLKIVGDFVTKVVSYLTFRNVGYAVGFLVGTVIKLFLLMRAQLLSLSLSMVTGVLKFFSTLPGKIGYLVGFLLGTVIRLFIQLNTRMINLAARAVIGVINFFSKLPSRVAAFMIRMVARAIGLMVRLRAELPKLAAQAANGVINFMAKLPGRVVTFIAHMVNRARAFFIRFKSDARHFAQGAADAMYNGLKGLPGLVGGILGKVISAFKGVVQSGFNAARDFAGGLWSGFKDGLGINSPSYIEKHMFQMNKTLDDETKKMAKKTASIQKIGNKWIGNTTKLGDSGSTSGTAKITRLARDQVKNTSRRQALLNNSGKRSARAEGDRRSSNKRKGPVQIKGDLKMTDSGAYISGFASGLDDDHDDYNDTLNRMR